MQTEVLKTTDPKEKPKKNMRAEILDWVKTLAIAMAIALVLRTFVFTLIRVDGTSMLETLQNNDILFATRFDRFFDSYERGDIVICNYPNVKGYRVKRVVGLPGDTIEVRDSVTYLNGEALDEPFVTYPARSNYGPYTVQDGEYFLMGDNRAVSKDSRSADVGAIDKGEIAGKVRIILFPFSHAGSPYQE